MRSVLLVVLALLLVVLGNMEQTDQNDTEVRYCEMVKLYEQTRGQEGWPNYKNEECK